MPGLLSGLLLLPLIGAALILAFRDESEANLRNIRSIALWTTIVTFAVSIVAWTRFGSVLCVVPAFGGVRLDIGIDQVSARR